MRWRDTEDVPRSGLLSPSVSGGYTFNPSVGIVPTQAPAPVKNQQNLADYLNTYSNLNTVDWASIGPALEKLGIGQNGKDGSAGWQFNNNIDAGDVGWSLTPEAAAKLQGWTVGDPRLQGDTVTQQIKDATGQSVGTSQEDHSKNLFWDQLAPAAIAGGAAFFGVPAIGGALGGGLLGGAAAGAGLGAATAAAQGNDIGKGLLMGGIGGGVSGYLGGVPDTSATPISSVAGVPDEVRQAIDAYAQSPMPDVMQGLPDFGSAQALPDFAQSFPVSQAPELSFSSGVPLERVTPPLQSSLWADSVPSEVQQSLQQASIQAPEQVQSLIPSWQPVQAPSWVDSVPSEVQSSLQQASVQTPEQVQSLIPSWQAPAPQEFRPSIDSQQYNVDAGITGSDAAKAATAPKTVNLPGNGGTMATSGGIQGAADLAAQTLRDATASPDIGGGLLSQAGGLGADAINKAGSALGSAGSWAAQNPMLAKLLLGGAGALLSSQGGNSAAPRAPVVPVQWKSPVQGIPQGLLSGVQSGGQSSQYPAAMGLLGGQQNSGAWRFLR
jgi:hypothetical protein